MGGPQGRSWIMDLFRSVLSWIDSLVYHAIEIVLQGIFDLASLKTSSELLTGVYTKIYVLVGIVMAFKLSFSFFQYIVNPESMAEGKETGVSNLFLRLFIMLLLLVTLPSILFGSNGSKGLLSEAQEIILPMIPNILLRDGDNPAPPIDTAKDAAKQIAVSSLSAFYFQPKELKEKCDAPPVKTIEDFTKTVNARCGNYYQYSYIIIANFIVGVLLLLMFLDITIDVAKRVFKLVILEVLAPIPIISYIDPKSSKDGAFGKWLQSLISTFVSLFIKIGVVYLILFFISQIVKNGLFEDFPAFTQEPLRAAYLTIFLILGLVYFAKEAPKFITDALGIKDTGGGKFGFGTLAALGGSVGAAAASYKASKLGDEARGKTPNKGKALMAGLLGGAGGLAGGMYAASDKNKWSDVAKYQRERNARVITQAASGSTFMGRLGAGASQMFAGETTAAKYQRTITGLEAEKTSLSTLADHVKGKVEKSNKTKGKFGSFQPGVDFNLQNVQRSYEMAKSTNADLIKVSDGNGNTYDLSYAEYDANIKALIGNNNDDYMQNYVLNVNGTTSASDIDTYAADLAKGIEESNIKYVDKTGASYSINDVISGAGGTKHLSDAAEVKQQNINTEKRKLEKAKANDKNAAGSK